MFHAGLEISTPAWISNRWSGTDSAFQVIQRAERHARLDTQVDPYRMAAGVADISCRARRPVDRKESHRLPGPRC